MEFLDARRAPSSLLPDLGTEPATSPTVLVGGDSGGDTSSGPAVDTTAAGTSYGAATPAASGTGDPGTGTDAASGPVYITAPPQNAAPRVVNFGAAEIVGGLWRFTGDVADEAPGGLTIWFGGEPASLENATATTDANGHFDEVFILRTDGSDNGLASAETRDSQGLDSNVAVYGIHPG
jgi:hypothetical protein